MRSFEGKQADCVEQWIHLDTGSDRGFDCGKKTEELSCPADGMGSLIRKAGFTGFQDQKCRTKGVKMTLERKHIFRSRPQCFGIPRIDSESQKK